MTAEGQSVVVAVVAICGAPLLKRCLDALAAQEQAPPFKVIVAYDPYLTDIPRLQECYPQICLIAHAGERTPVDLAARAVREADGDLVLLTEDHCEPRPDWVRRLCAALSSDRAAVGGVVETDRDASALDWAFYYVDFFRYLSPVSPGPVHSLSVCNVAYRRAALKVISPVWATAFHETTVNDALRTRVGPLWMVPEAEVLMRRQVRFADAIYERYAFGRLFGCTRLDFVSPGRRLYYRTFAPVLPLLLLSRMAGKAFRCRRILPKFLHTLPLLLPLVLAWSWGEWLGYLTRRPPRSLLVAAERHD
jgi:glycosyl transferase family 2